MCIRDRECLEEEGSRVMASTIEMADFDENYDIAAVSYTHQDVYKRQELERVRSVRHLTDWCQVSSKEHMADA